ncbi:putative tetR-family transcriptional regulator [Streptomyces ambofaciens ATCC 23877]|uniref:TetR family transcriptional regulator n=2 Tax=Streptomyces ambofaciens TaxID=1889 RepID=A0ABM6B8I9_STRAM|nr:TetR/AcrR family transcriptional regulator [Streptomyces ambofaciens]AKZ59955.1 putative tetR-family transcriptional regulator [Streptomyces ambofaciens ATCC 23877]ANB10187.1 TetR family transcriptional regulator [Streptomyces ambofaciens]CAJ88380.1 putative tetR-family transcriptional regulator [Streptomyces ambofaciens ATCC 23877]
MQLMSEKGTAGGGLRERKKRATRVALTEAAVRLAAEHGAEKVTVEAISAAAGVSVRTFFNYFDTRDDVFVLTGADTSAHVRRALLAAPAGLTPLEALRDALAAELAEAEQQHELWRLHGKVLRAAPHLFVRSLGAHMADETELAEAIAERMRPVTGAPGDAPAPPAASDEERRQALDLYPRLLAAVAVTAVRVSIDHWCARPEVRAFSDVFQEVFTLLAAGLPAPPA